MLYFKIARVHKKEEKSNSAIMIQHAVVAIAALLFYILAFQSGNYLTIVVESLVSFILAALAITAVQLGIFVDGRPLFGLSHIYKFLPFLTTLITIFVLLNL